MPDPSQFRHYQIVQDADENNVELLRNGEQVAVLAFDTARLEFVHCHVLLEPLKNRTQFEETCIKLRKSGHPLLAGLIDFGDDEGNPFYITTNVDGETLGNYLSRQPELPAWLAVMIACRALEAVTAVCERGEFLTVHPLDSLRIIQAGPQSVHVMAADYLVLPGAAIKSTGLKPPFDKQAKLLRTFLVEQTGKGPTLPDHSIPGADFTELLNSCLSSASPGVVMNLREFRNSLQKLVPESVTGEIPTSLKPRSILAPLLASYQEVARGMVNLVRIQSQRLDMANPYSMRGTLTKTGRLVMVEQVPPSRLCTVAVGELDKATLQLAKRREFSSLVSLALVNDSEGVTCLAEELAEGISLADLLRERRCLDVHESYLLLAGLDAALTQVEEAKLGTRKIRLEDIFLLTGFPREDARSTKLMVSKLNEWPAFSITVRAHPILASLSGRGSDPAGLLGLPSVPVPEDEHGANSPWHGGWLAALSKYLLAFETIPGVTADPQGGARERQTIGRLLDDELFKSREGTLTKRSDFLARYARIIHHHDLAKPSTAPAASATLDIIAKPKPSRTIPVSKGSPSGALSYGESAVIPQALTMGLPTAPVERPSIGFAEALFTGTSQAADASGPDWVKTAVDAPPTLREALLPPKDYVPFWLRASVFLGGSMVAGAFFANVSGKALWQQQKNSSPRLPPAAVAPINSPSQTYMGGLSNAASAATNRPKSLPESSNTPKNAALEVTLPPLPPDNGVPTGSSMLKPPSQSLKSLLEGSETPK